MVTTLPINERKHSEQSKMRQNISHSSLKDLSVAVPQRKEESNYAMSQAAKLQADCLSRRQREALKERARRSPGTGIQML